MVFGGLRACGGCLEGCAHILVFGGLCACEDIWRVVCVCVGVFGGLCT